MTPSGWLPIADAPKDGSLIKVCCVRWGKKLHIEKCKWNKRYWSTAYFGNRFANGIFDPTHFMMDTVEDEQ